MLLCTSTPNDTAGDIVAFTHRLEQQVLLTPNAIAIEFEGRSWTYQEINQRANQVARFLLQQFAEPEVRIGICMDRSADAIVCMLGILKSGCAFVPLDPEFPRDRLAYIVDDASIAWIFCDEKYRDLYDTSSPNAPVFQDLSDPVIWNQDDTNLEMELRDDALAYVMYTSGSTGKPKGVQIEHGSLTTYCLADVELYQLTQQDRTLQFSTLNFDIAIEEIFPPLLVGSTIVVRPRERSENHNELSSLVETYQITSLHIATAYWHEWVDLLVASNANVPPSLRLLIATGEKVSVEHFRRWKRQCRHDVLWCNAYGPTETTVTCTCFIPNENWDEAQMPIGKPLKGYSAHILNDQNQEVGIGETGSLFIGGRALARGYLNRPELNAKAFIEVALAGNADPSRLYRTGDLARWLPSGDIEFSGRVDHQMKIGSYRIEPGEIEAVLSQCPVVDESLVVCFENGGQKVLAAYIVSNDKSAIAWQLSNFLRDRLPVYMIPSRYLFIDAFPKTINGKIDRPALPPPESGEVARLGDFCETETQLERDLASIWSRVLNVAQVSRHDDFFQLGGSSLLVTRAIAQMTQLLKITIPVRDFFANPTVASLSCHLQEISQTNNDSDTANQQKTSQARAIQARAKLPTIQPLVIQSGQYRLAAIRYPAMLNAHADRKHTIVICNAVGHEHTRSFRNLQQLAIRLAQLGFDVLRFDFACSGNSQGSESAASLDQWRNDIASVVDSIRVRQESLLTVAPRKISLVGIRLGAALMAQTPIEGIEHAIYWDPVLDGAGHIEEQRALHKHELRSLTRYLNIRSGHDEQFIGYHYSNALQTSIAAIRPQEPVLLQAQRNWLLTSKDQIGSLTLAQALSEWDHQPNQDEIYWGDSRFIQAAFSSPQTMNQIESILTEGTL